MGSCARSKAQMCLGRHAEACALHVSFCLLPAQLCSKLACMSQSSVSAARQCQLRLVTACRGQSVQLKGKRC